MDHILQLGELEFFASALSSPAIVEPFDKRYGVFVTVDGRAKLVALYQAESNAVQECTRINKWMSEHCDSASLETVAPVQKLEFEEND